MGAPSRGCNMSIRFLPYDDMVIKCRESPITSSAGGRSPSPSATSSPSRASTPSPSPARPPPRASRWGWCSITSPPRTRCSCTRSPTSARRSGAGSTSGSGRGPSTGGPSPAFSPRRWPSSFPWTRSAAPSTACPGRSRAAPSTPRRSPRSTPRRPAPALDELAQAVRNGKECGEVAEEVDPRPAAVRLAAVTEGLALQVYRAPGELDETALAIIEAELAVVFTGECRQYAPRAARAGR